MIEKFFNELVFEKRNFFLSNKDINTFVNIHISISYHRDILIVLFICYRREAISVHMGRLHVEIRTIGRADAALSQTHGPKAVQVSSLSAIVFAERSLVAPHEEALMVRTV